MPSEGREERVLEGVAYALKASLEHLGQHSLVFNKKMCQIVHLHNTLFLYKLAEPGLHLKPIRGCGSFGISEREH